MITINKITTKTGDSGKTLGPEMKSTGKFEPQIEVIGKIDELNAFLGQIIGSQTIAILGKRKILKIITEIQHQLFDIGSMFFTQDAEKCIQLIDFLEKHILEYSKNAPTLDSFLLPQGGFGVKKFIASLHIARSSARTAERIFWKNYFEDEMKNAKTKNIGIYLNRLSDLLFAIIRKYSTKKWVPLIKRL